MKKIGIITLTGYINYGNILQNYALQTFLYKLSKENIATTLWFENTDLKIYKKFLLKLSYISNCKGFGNFINKLIHFSKAVRDYNFKNFHNKYITSIHEKNIVGLNNKYDYFVAGSDQIWNPRCTDFSWAYYLNFIHEKPKISYAVSMGPHCVLKDDEKKYIKEYIEDYKYISVREIGTLVTLNNVTGVKNNFPVLIDPVLLFSSTFWNKFIEDNKERFVVPSKPYILFYTLGCSDTIYKFVKKIEKKLKKRVIITKPMHRFDFFNYFENRFDTGPVDFLFLIKEADLIITTSFHACVFSAIFHKQFFAVDVENDNRIQDFLSKYNLNSVNIQSSKTDLSFCVENQMVAKFDYSCFDTKVNEERIIAKDFLKKSLAK